MTTSPVRAATLVLILCAAVVAGRTQSALAGVPSTTYADVNGVCASHTPCYTKIQDALKAVGGPNDATVFVFPGTYNESVNLNGMASSSNQTFANLALRTVDAAGAPAPGTATIHGPSPISTTAQGFPRDVTIDGFILQPTQKSGIDIQVGGSITLSNATATNAPGNGFDLATAGNGSVTIEHSSSDGAHGPGADGFDVSSGGNVTITDATATNSTGGAESDGFDITSTYDVIVSGAVAADNQGRGMFVQQLSEDAQVAVSSSSFEDNHDSGLYIAAPSSAFAGGVTASGNMGWGIVAFLSGASGHFGAESVRADGNGQAGIFAQTPGDVVINNTHLEGNTNDGAHVMADGRVQINRVGVIGNGEGILLTPNSSGGRVASSTIEGSLLKDNGLGAELVDLSSTGLHEASGNVICGNSIAGLDLKADATLNAPGNWWGDASGPLHPNNPSATGDEAIDGANGGAGTIQFDPWITHADLQQQAGPAGPTGNLSTLSFAFRDNTGTYFLKDGPGDDLVPSPVSMSTDNGLLRAGGVTDTSVRSFIEDIHTNVTLIPGHSGDAAITLDGPCGLDGQITANIEPGLSWGDLNCDGTIGPADVLRGLRYTDGLSLDDIAGCGVDFAAYDLDCTGTLDGREPLLIALHVAELPPLSVRTGCPAVGS